RRQPAVLASPSRTGICPSAPVSLRASAPPDSLRAARAVALLAVRWPAACCRPRPRLLAPGWPCGGARARSGPFRGQGHRDLDEVAVGVAHVDGADGA